MRGSDAVLRLGGKDEPEIANSTDSPTDTESIDPQEIPKAIELDSPLVTSKGAEKAIAAEAADVGEDGGGSEPARPPSKLRRSLGVKCKRQVAYASTESGRMKDEASLSTVARRVLPHTRTFTPGTLFALTTGDGRMQYQEAGGLFESWEETVKKRMKEREVANAPDRLG